MTVKLIPLDAKYITFGPQIGVERLSFTNEVVPGGYYSEANAVGMPAVSSYVILHMKNGSTIGWCLPENAIYSLFVENEDKK